MWVGTVRAMSAISQEDSRINLEWRLRLWLLCVSFLLSL